MSAVATAIVGGAVIGGYMTSQATKSAAQTQADAAARAQGQLLETGERAADVYAPYVAKGVTALNKMSDDPYFTQQFTNKDLNATLAPGYDFRLRQGQQANLQASNLTGGSGTNGSVRATISAGPIRSVSAVSIVDPGCAYVVGDTLTVSGATGIGFSSPSTLSVAEINNNVGDGIELSGFNQNDLNGVYKILSIPTSKSFTIYNPAGVSNYTQNTNGRIPVAVLSSKGIGITSFRFDTVTSGIVTVTTSTAHGLLPGNKFTIVGSGHTIYDSSFFVEENVGITTFAFYVGDVTQTKQSTKGTLLKHGISANALNLTRGEENLGSRGSYIYAGITTTLTTTLTTSSSTIGLSAADGFKRGDYILINAEILRLASAPSGNTFAVLRSLFSTYKTTAIPGTQVKKIKVLPMEVRRPSFMRASGHTFEYCGTGIDPATALPQLGGIPIEANEVIEENGGKVYYTSTDQKGNFKIGGDLTIDRGLGTITGITFDKSLFAVMTPYILALEG